MRQFQGARDRFSTVRRKKFHSPDERGTSAGRRGRRRPPWRRAYRSQAFTELRDERPRPRIDGERLQLRHGPRSDGRAGARGPFGVDVSELRRDEEEWTLLRSPNEPSAGGGPGRRLSPTECRVHVLGVHDDPLDRAGHDTGCVVARPTVRNRGGRYLHNTPRGILVPGTSRERTRHVQSRDVQAVREDDVGRLRSARGTGDAGRIRLRTLPRSCGGSARFQSRIAFPSFRPPMTQRHLHR